MRINCDESLEGMQDSLSIEKKKKLFPMEEKGVFFFFLINVYPFYIYIYRDLTGRKIACWSYRMRWV